MRTWSGTVDIHNGRYPRSFTVEVDASTTEAAVGRAIREAVRQRRKLTDNRPERTAVVSLRLTAMPSGYRKVVTESAAA